MNQKKVRVGYYPGCALHGTSFEYDVSIRRTNEKFAVELVEIEDWSCCGASSAHMTNFKLNAALNARNLTLAAEQQLTEVLAPCPLCSKVMLEVNQQLSEDSELRAEINEVLGKTYKPGVQVLNYLQFVERYYLPDLKDKLERKFDDLKVACYYGCLLTRPPEVVKFDDAEQPETFERIMNILGVEPIEWSFRTECCGGGFTLADAQLVATLTQRILADAQQNGAKAIIVACPMCHANLDMRQTDIRNLSGIDFNLPIIYLSELIGLALGLSANEIAITKHLTGVTRVLQKVK